MLRRPRTLVVSAGLAVAGAITLTACGGGASSGTTGSPAPSSTAAAGQSAANGANPAGAGGRGPAASGTIAEVDGTTMQVQNQQDGQVAVTWTAKTTFTQQAQVALSSVKAGDCVTALAASSGSSSSASNAPSAPLTATTIAVSQPVNGACTGGFGAGGQRSFPSGSRPSGLPTGSRPSGFPSGAQNRAGFNFGGIASGKVVSVSGSSIVVAARTFSGQANSSSAPTATTTNRTVTVTSSTKITTEQKATAAAVKVGRCATAQGAADSSGTVAATQVSITDPVNGQCTAGFGRGNFRGGAGSGASANAGGTGA